MLFFLPDLKLSLGSVSNSNVLTMRIETRMARGKIREGIHSSFQIWKLKMIKDANVPAAAGMGYPLKLIFSGPDTPTLKRASRMVPKIKGKKLIIKPAGPILFRWIW